MDQQEQFFSIQQVSLKLKIPKPTLRYWEKELNDIICPLRTHGGQRRYNIEHISVLAKISKLRSKGMSISEIKRELGERILIKDNFSEPNKIDFLADHIAKIVRSEIYSFLHNNNSEKYKL
jgi:DNA-binding transcriptional MerR regulator